MGPIKFSYFDVEGLGEPVRMALAQSGVEWIDDRISLEEWPALKPTLPYGQVPVMEVDGKLIPQSAAQLRYIGKLGHMYPTDPIQAAFADSVVDAVMDIHPPMRDLYDEKDEEKKMEMRKDLAENSLPAWLANVEKVLQSAGGMYFAGGKLSIGDIAVVARLNMLKDGILDGIPTTILDGFPLLSSLVERVMAEPKIVAYTEERSKN